MESGQCEYSVTYRASWVNGIDKRVSRQAPNADAIVVVHVAAFGGAALRATINRTDDFTGVANGTPRAELAFIGLTRFAVGGEYEVRWSTMIPRGYELDERQPEIITQIHQSSTQGSPPFELMLAGDSYRVGVRGPHTVKSFAFGHPLEDEGKIVSWMLHYRPDDTGASSITDLYKDGKLVVQGGPVRNAYPNDREAYLKIGIYKWDWKVSPSDTTVRIMYYGDIEVLSRKGANQINLDGKK